MNSQTKKLLGQYAAVMHLMTHIETMMAINMLAMQQVDDYIEVHPLPEGIDPEEARAVMLVMTVARASERVHELLTCEAATSSAGNEEQAKVIADAAITKAQGKLQ